MDISAVFTVAPAAPQADGAPMASADGGQGEAKFEDMVASLFGPSAKKASARGGEATSEGDAAETADIPDAPAGDWLAFLAQVRHFADPAARQAFFDSLAASDAAAAVALEPQAPEMPATPALPGQAEAQATDAGAEFAQLLAPAAMPETQTEQPEEAAPAPLPEIMENHPIAAAPAPAGLPAPPPVIDRLLRVYVSRPEEADEAVFAQPEAQDMAAAVALQAGQDAPEADAQPQGRPEAEAPAPAPKIFAAPEARLAAMPDEPSDDGEAKPVLPVASDFGVPLPAASILREASFSPSPKILAPAVLDAPAPEPAAEQVSVAIRKAPFASDRISVRLQPESLGRVEVRMQVSREGILKASVMAETDQAMNMLKNEAHSLTRALNASGFRIAATDVVFSVRSPAGEAFGGDGGGGGQGQPQHQQQHNQPDPQAFAAAMAAAEPGRFAPVNMEV
ncbi:hypothetical protein FACS1894186_5150 [Alphaproteobacteria bacterium]|nr:hypothetical protein FACS1894186_5150 [Alphaproteobacteria bacterium]